MVSKDLEIHKDVEIKIAEKNQKLSKIIKSYEETSPDLVTGLQRKNTMSSNGTGSSHPSITNLHVNNLNSQNSLNSIHINGSMTAKAAGNNVISLKETNKDNIFDVKLRRLETELQKKQESFSVLKYNFDLIQEKLISYEKKYSVIFGMFEEGFKKLMDETSNQDFKEVNLNFDLLKDGNFESLSSEQKYSLLVILMNHVLPLINPQQLQNSEFSRHNLGNVKIKYHFSNVNRFNEALYKKMEGSPVNSLGLGLSGLGINGVKSTSNKSFMQNLPLINDIFKTGKNKRNNSVSNFQIST